MTTTSATGARLLSATAVGLAVLVPLALAVFAARSAHLMVKDLSAELEARQDSVARIRAIATVGRRGIDGAKSNDAEALTADFLAGVQDPIIVAELQDRLRTLANARNVELNSANALPIKTIEGLAYLGIRVVFRGQLGDIQHVMHAVETGGPLLFIERLSLRKDTWPMKSADPALDGAPALVVELDVYGAKQLPDAPSAAPATAAAAKAPASLNPFPTAPVSSHSQVPR